MNSYSEIEKTTDDYLKQKTWEVRENSNINYSWAGLLLNITGKVIANYTLDRVYSPQIAAAHRSGDFHIHNLYFGIVGYCAGWDLKKLLWEGLNSVPGKIESKPPRHFDTALMQMVNFMGTIQNEWAGAQSFNAIDTLLAPFVYYDKLSYAETKQAVQKFIYNLNIASRWGSQTPFTNISLDWNVSNDLAEQHAVIGGKQVSRTYSDFEKQAEMINKSLIEVYLEGDMNARPFTFPIPSYNITKDFDWDSENATLLFELTAKYGLPYFSNFINSDMKPSDIRSMCCRM
ncbi:MAG: anaerobic ribonucleoside-triphosphate reductase, partial [archaeon]